MKGRLLQNERTDLEAIETIPKNSKVWKAVGWGIPLVIIGSIAYIALTQGADAAGENAMIWFLANSIPSGLGALLAMGHPITILAAAISAPFTSLSPLIGAGYVAAFTQLWAAPPKVADFSTVGDDLSIPKRWWQSRLMRIFLVFVLSTIGSAIGTYTGGFNVIRNLIDATG